MRILVLGCNGMLGHVVSLYFAEQGHDVDGFARKKLLSINTVLGDAENLPFLEKIIHEGNYDAIVNCIGILNQAAEEHKASAVFLNAYLPHWLVACVRNMPAKIVHISTDCVFSGKTGGYTENSPTDGQAFYDKSKALGEIVDEKNITLRTSIVGPSIDISGGGLFNWFMKQSGTIDGYTKAIWTGQTTLQLAKTIEQAIIQNAVGLHNVVPGSSISKYDLLKMFNEIFRAGEIDIHPDGTVVLDKSLKRTNYALNYIIPGYSDMLHEMKTWIYGHQELYPHYIE